MNRLLSYLKGKAEEIKISNKVKKVNIALEASLANFESDKLDAELAAEKALEKIADSTNIEEALQDLSNAITKKEEAEAGIKRVEAMKAFITEDIK